MRRGFKGIKNIWKLIYFTSDLHFGQKYVVQLYRKTFFTPEQMNKAIIANINAIVGPDDISYILGDVCNRGKREIIKEYLDNMHGHKILVRGNHDPRSRDDLYEQVSDFECITYKKIRFVLMHYPILSWPFMSSGAIHLHGHLHAAPEYNQSNRNNGILRYDVGLDANNLRPVSIDEIITFFQGTKPR